PRAAPSASLKPRVAPAAAGAAHAAGGRHLGRPMARLEDRAVLTGRGQYGDDQPLKSGTLHAAIVRSPHAHARIVRVDAGAALSVPGVRAVLTPEDVAAWSRPFVVGVKQPMEQWALAQDKVRYVGEPVAVVIAESRYLAEDGADRVVVDYETLPAVVDVTAAAEPQAA